MYLEILWHDDLYGFIYCWFFHEECIFVQGKIGFWLHTDTAYCWQLASSIWAFLNSASVGAFPIRDHSIQQGTDFWQHGSLFVFFVITKVTDCICGSIGDAYGFAAEVFTLATGMSSFTLVTSTPSVPICDNVSADWFLIPAPCIMSKANSNKQSREIASMSVSSDQLKIHFKKTWSVRTLNIVSSK